MTCEFTTRNEKNELTLVASPRGLPSELFKTLLSTTVLPRYKGKFELPDVRAHVESGAVPDNSDANRALIAYAATRTDAFKKWFGAGKLDRLGDPQLSSNFEYMNEKGQTMSALRLAKKMPYTANEIANSTDDSTQRVKSSPVSPILRDEASEKLVETTAKRLSLKYDIPVTFVRDEHPDAPKGQFVFEKGKTLVVINLAKATADTPFHEFFHPIVIHLKATNKALYDKLMREFDSEEDLVENLGRLAVDPTNKQKTDLLSEFFRWVQQTMAKLFNLPLYFDPKALYSLSDLNIHSSIYDVVNLISGIKEGGSTNNNNTESLTLDSEWEGVYNQSVSELQKRGVPLRSELVDEILAKSEANDLITHEDHYSTRMGDKTYSRLTMWVAEQLIGKDVTSNRFKKAAERKFRNLADDATVDFSYTIYDPTQGKEVSKTKKVNKAQYEEELALAQLKATELGTFIHLFLSYLFSTNIATRDRLEKDLRSTSTLLFSTPEFTKVPRIAKLLANISNICEASGISIVIDKETLAPKKGESDTFLSEFSVKSDLLGIASTIDGLSVDVDGFATMLDFKTGALLSDVGINTYFKYGGEVRDVQATKANIAKMEVMLRALMLKEQHPEIRYKGLKVVQINYLGIPTVVEVDVENSLQLLREYFKVTNPELFKTLTEKGLLTTSTYNTTELLENKYAHIAKMHPAEAIKALRSLIISTEWELNRAIEGKQRKDEKIYSEELASLTKMYYNLRRDSGLNEKDDFEDLLPSSGWFKNIGDYDNTYAKAWKKDFDRSNTRASKETEELLGDFDNKLKNYLEEQGVNTKVSRTRALKKINIAAITISILTGNLVLAAAIGGFEFYRASSQTKRKDLYRFFFKHRVIDGVSNSFVNLEDTYEDELGKTVNMTKAQKALRDTAVELFHSQWKRTMVDEGKIKRSGELYNLTELPADFFPKLTKTPLEMMEEVDLKSTANVSDAIRSKWINFVSNKIVSSDKEENDVLIPTKGISYNDGLVSFGNVNLTIEDSHSYDLEYIVNVFTKNMVSKREKDFNYIYAQALAKFIEDDKKPGTADAFNKLATKLTLDRRDPAVEKIGSIRMNMRVGKQLAEITGKEEGQLIRFELFNMFDFARSTASATFMAFKFRPRLFEAVLNTLLIMRRAMTNDAMRLFFGVPPKERTIGLANLRRSYGFYMEYIAYSFLGTPEKSKLYNVAKRINWQGENIEGYFGIVSDLRANSNMVSIKDLMFSLSAFVENYSSMIYLGALLDSHKWEYEMVGEGGTKTKKKISAWDSYDSDGNWNKEHKRGIAKDGIEEEELYELNYREIAAMKRDHERVFGSYRKEEQIGLETTVFGSMFLQFKRFAPRYVKNLLGAGRIDPSTGTYQQILDTYSEKQPDGTIIEKKVSKLEWVSNVEIGSLRALGNSLFTAKRHMKKWKAGDMTSAEKREFANLLGNLVFTTTTLLATSSFYGEDGGLDRRLDRLNRDVTTFLDPKDINDLISDVTPVSVKAVSNLVTSGWDLVTEPFESDPDYEQKLKTFTRNAPGLSGISQTWELLEDKKK